MGNGLGKKSATIFFVNIPSNVLFQMELRASACLKNIVAMGLL
jgi:hypothetical protein